MEKGGMGICIEEMKEWLDGRGEERVNRCIEDIKRLLNGRGGSG
jgi:hypothetical protein